MLVKYNQKHFTSPRVQQHQPTVHSLQLQHTSRKHISHAILKVQRPKPALKGVGVDKTIPIHHAAAAERILHGFQLEGVFFRGLLGRGGFGDTAFGDGLSERVSSTVVFKEKNGKEKGKRKGTGSTYCQTTSRLSSASWASSGSCGSTRPCPGCRC